MAAVRVGAWVRCTHGHHGPEGLVGRVASIKIPSKGDKKRTAAATLTLSDGMPHNGHRVKDLRPMTEAEAALYVLASPPVQPTYTTASITPGNAIVFLSTRVVVVKP